MPTNRVEIKELTDDYAIVAGYGVVYGGEDLQGETFSPNTDYDLDLVPTKRVYYDHTLTGIEHDLGAVVKIDPREAGLWIEAQLERSKDYVEEVLRLVEEGAIGISSGSVSHLVRREGKFIKRWPLVEFSLTPTPAEPRTIGVERLKALGFEIEEADVKSEPEAQPETPTGVVSAADDDMDATSDITTITIEEGNMPDENKTAAPPAEDRIEGLEGQVKGLSEQLTNLMHILETEPVGKSGYVSEDGGNADPHVKSFGDFLLAIYRNDTKRLNEVYKSTKDLGTTEGSAGGFLVPEEYSSQLLQMARENSPILSRVQRVPVGSMAGSYPALDQYVTPTAGSGETAMAAGVKATTTAEGATLTETDAQFIELDWRVKKIGGYTEVRNELIRTSPTSIDNLLRQLFSVAVMSKKERHILRGNGAGEYLGILNAPATISVTPDTNNVFAYADMLEMHSRWKRILSDGVWLAHPGLIPDIGVFEIGTNGAGVPQGTGATAGTMNMPGSPYPVIYNEHLPQDDNSGCVVLADLQAYLVFELGGLSIAFSEHAAFTEDKGTWRFTELSDGMPWVKNYITLADPQGSYTVSPFVKFND